MRRSLYWFIRILKGQKVPDREITWILDSFEAGDWIGTRFDDLIMQCIRLGWPENIPADMIEEAEALLEEMRT